MRLASKHSNQQLLELTDFTGGLNTSTTEEQIAANQLAESVNFEIQSITGLLKTVNGTKQLYRAESTRDYNFVSIAYDVLNNHIVLFADNGSVFSANRNDLSQFRLIGRLSGRLTPITVVWESGLLVASGGKLQYIIGYQMQTISSSPSKCNGVFVRSGRVIVFDEENITYSGVGDETNWEQDSNDSSDSIWVEAGYKVGGNLIGLVNLSSDVVMIKDNGKILKLSGEYPDWAITPVASNVACSGRLAFCNMVNNVFILGDSSIRVIETTQDYGDMKAASISDNVEREIRELSADVKVRYITDINQIWLIDDTDTVLFYDAKLNAFFKRRFNAKVVDVISIHSTVYVLKENGLDYLDEESYSDEGAYLEYKLKGKTNISHNNYLLKRVVWACTGYGTSNDVFLLIDNTVKVPCPVQSLLYGKVPVYDNQNYVYHNTDIVYDKTGKAKVVYSNKSVFVYDDIDYVYGNTDYVVDYDTYAMHDKRIRFRDKYLSLMIEGKGSKFVINKIQLDVVEV